jgi:hypothetical protein
MAHDHPPHDGHDHGHHHGHDHGHTQGATFAEWTQKAGELHASMQSGNIPDLKEALHHLKEHLEETAKIDKKGAGRLFSLLEDIEEHIEHTHKEHGTEGKEMKKLSGMIEELGQIAKRHAKAEKPFDSIYEDAKLLFKEHGITVTGTLKHDPKLSRFAEMKAQVADHFSKPGRTMFGKGISIIGGTVGLGVVMHGAVNMKRGIMGYHDPETGEQKKGSLSNIVVGAGEAAAGMFAIKRALTGGWSLGRATNQRAHDHHDHGHDHGHHHH